MKRWEKNDPSFRQAVEEHIEKAKLGLMPKELREKEHLTQALLAEKANVAQSVIAGIETNALRTLPRLDLFKRILL